MCLIMLHSCDIWWEKGSGFTEIVQLHVTGSSYSFVHQIFYDALKGIWSWLVPDMQGQSGPEEEKRYFQLGSRCEWYFSHQKQPERRAFHHKGKWLSEEKGHAVPPLITPVYRNVQPHREPFCCWGVATHKPHFQEDVNHKSQIGV